MHLFFCISFPSPDSLAGSSEQPPNIQNGDHSDAAREGKEKEARKKGSQEDGDTAGPSRVQEEAGERSRHRVQVRVFLIFVFMTHLKTSNVFCFISKTQIPFKAFKIPL